MIPKDFPAYPTTSADHNPLGRLLRKIHHSQVLQNVITVMGGSICARAIGLLTTWLIVRHLSTAEYGVFAVLDNMGTFGAALLTAGTNLAMIKTVATLKNEPRKAWSIARTILKIDLLYGLVIAVVMVFGADLIAVHVLRKPELAFYLRLSSIGVLGSVLFGYRSAVFQAWKRFRMDATYTLCNSAAYLLVVVALLWSGYFGIDTVAPAYVVTPVVISGLAVLMLRKDLAKPIHLSTHQIVNILGNTYACTLFYTLCLAFVEQLHIIILTRYSSMSEVGLYAFAYKMYGILLLLMHSINTVLFPTYSSIDDKDALRHAFQDGIKGTALVSLCFLVMIPFLGYFITIFAGFAYVKAEAILQILTFGAALSTLLSPPANILFALNKFRIIMLGGVLIVCINITGHVFITRYYGGLGAALTQVMSHFVLNGYFTFHVYRQLYVHVERQEALWAE